jgi:hypothetical protein
MRAFPAVAALAAASLVAAIAHGAPSSSAKAAALQAGDWRHAAQLGASAAEVVRALHAKGRFSDVAPDEAVVTIRADNTIDVVALKPLPPLPGGTTAAARTVGLSGSGFAFSAKPGSIILYPANAQTFAAQQPLPGPPRR